MFCRYFIAINDKSLISLNKYNYKVCVYRFLLKLFFDSFQTPIGETSFTDIETPGDLVKGVSFYYTYGPNTVPFPAVFHLQLGDPIIGGDYAMVLGQFEGHVKVSIFWLLKSNVLITAHCSHSFFHLSISDP